jgi:PAS domain S-box-containing protein
MTLEELLADPVFHSVAVRQVEQDGYTVLSNRQGRILLHEHPQYVGADLTHYGAEWPELSSIILQLRARDTVQGRYRWADPDGRVRRKYLWGSVVQTPTADGVRLAVIATAYQDALDQEVSAIGDQVSRAATQIESAHAAIARRVRIMVLGVSLLVAAGGFMLIRRVTRPIRELVDATRQLTHGDLDVRAPDTADNEIGELGRSFNIMAESLQVRENTFSQMNTQLESRIEQRTEQLRCANDRLQQEVADRKRAEGEVRRSKNYLQAIIDGIADPMLVIDRNYNIRLVNHALQHGWAKGRYTLGRRCFEHAAGNANCCDMGQQCPVEQIVRTRAPVTKVVEHVDDDGARRIVEITGWPMLDETGDVVQIIESWRDITEQKLSEQRLRRIQAAVDRASDAIVILNSEGLVVYANRAFAELFDCGQADYEHRRLAPLLAEPDRADELAREADDRSREIELEMRTAAGEPFTASVKRTPIADDAARKIGTLLMISDVTERRRSEASLRHTQKLKSIGQLAAGIAHEINTPTQFIGDNTRFLEQGFKDLDQLLNRYEEAVGALDAAAAEALQARLDEARAAADLEYLRDEIPLAISQSLDGIDRVTQIVKAMKEFSHPDGREPAPTDLNRAIRSTIAISRNEWKYVAEVVAELDEELPMVPCLEGEFNQVVLNLLVNAAHAIRDVVGDSGAKGTITVRTRCEGDEAVIEVADTGAGVPEEIRSRIFDPFFTTKETGEGSGQGLAVAHAVIVEKHQGRIDVDSAVGAGSTFTIRLPMSPSAAGKEPQHA